MGLITTSLVIDFSSDDGSGILKAEIDGREDGYNEGDTSFRPGDSPVFLIYKSSGVTVESITPSVGTISQIAQGSHANDYSSPERITFANEKEGAPRYPIGGGFSYKWLGTNGGVATENESLITIPSKAVAVLDVEYQTSYTAYRLNNVPGKLNGETSFPVIIFISGVQE